MQLTISHDIQDNHKTFGAGSEFCIGMIFTFLVENEIQLESVRPIFPFFLHILSVNNGHRLAISSYNFAVGCTSLKSSRLYAKFSFWRVTVRVLPSSELITPA